MASTSLTTARTLSMRGPFCQLAPATFAWACMADGSAAHATEQSSSDGRSIDPSGGGILLVDPPENELPPVRPLLAAAAARRLRWIGCRRLAQRSHPDADDLGLGVEHEAKHD